MKKSLVPLLCIMFGVVTHAFCQEKEVRSLEVFSKANLIGNIEVHLIVSTEPSIEIEVRKNGNLNEYKTEVRNGELFFYHQRQLQNQETPKVIINLRHTGIEHFDLSGIIKLFSEDVIQQPKLTINGSGKIRGKIQVSVKELHIDLSGISNMKVAGKADNVEFNADGMSKIKAKKLETNRAKKNAGGLSKIKLVKK